MDNFEDQPNAFSALIRERCTIESLLQLVESQGYDDSADEAGRTPLHHAVLTHNDPEVIRLLVKSGADLESRDVNGRTPLFEACSMGVKFPLESIILMIELGADVNTQDDDDNTLLIASICYPEDRSMQDMNRMLMLMDAGCDVNVECEGYTALHHFCKMQFVYNYYQYYDVDCKLVLSVLKKLIACGADVHKVDYKGRNALYFAIESGNTDIVQILLDQGSEIQIPVHFYDRSQPGALRCIKMADDASRARFSALCMGLHPRLGEESPVQILNQDIMSLIWKQYYDL